ncbi:MAG TPA: methylenetetrahydrofolate reductase [Desulfomonilaceae bacterium]|nr:methylenetetrahydrofolate reductase [Desulfomonilaceae bacterium]
MSLKHALETNNFIVTCEIHLPHGKAPQDYLDEIYTLWGRVDGVRFHPFATDAAISDSLSLCRILREKKFDPVFQVGTRDRNRLEIQEALIHASSVGVENLLLFTDDYRITGDSLQEMMFFHVDVGKFFSVIDCLKKGTDVHGKDLDGEKDFFIGSGVESCFGGNCPDMELREMEKLVEQGTKYFLTTPVFDVDEFAKFVKRVAPLGVPIIAELLMLHTGMEARMLQRVGGLNIPDRLIQRIEKAPVKFDESAKVLLETADQLKDICAGIHILPFGWEHKIGRVLQEIKRSKFR